MSKPGLLPDFRSLPTHHCVTGSMLQVFAHHGLDVSEDMLLGLGAGVGFFYWHAKGTTPMLLGRGNTARPGTDGLEIDASRRLGIAAERRTTGSRKKAHESLVDEIAAGRPVMVQVDMGLLPYFDFPEDYHFGGHVVVVAGDRDDHMWVADRDEDVHLVPTEALRDARNSRHKPFPPKNTWYRFDLSGARPPRPADVRGAIAANADAMLHGPIANLGVRGIRKAARLIPRWTTMLTPDELRRACLDNYIFIDAVGGTGGGMFRAMYGRFLAEAAELVGTPDLAAQSVGFAEVAGAWDEVASTFKAVYDGADPAALIGLNDRLSAIADAEQGLWRSLAAWAV